MINERGGIQTEREGERHRKMRGIVYIEIERCHWGRDKQKEREREREGESERGRKKEGKRKREREREITMFQGDTTGGYLAIC